MHAPAAADDRGWIRREAWPALSFLLVLLAIPALALAFGGFTLNGAELAPIYAIFAIFLGCAIRLRRLGRVRLADILAVSGLFYLAAATTTLACAVMASTGLPYVDEPLAAADRALGFDWMAMIRLFCAHPVPARLLIAAYDSLSWAPQLLIVLLGLLRPPAMAYRFLTTWTLGLLLTTLLFPLFPNIAAFHHYGLSPAMMPGHTAQVSWDLPGIMEGLRSGTNRTLGFAALTGIVGMPSFHAAGAIMLLWGYARFALLRWPAALLFGAMFFAAVPVGGHYLVEIIAGLGVALAAILLSGVIHRALDAERERIGQAAPAPA